MPIAGLKLFERSHVRLRCAALAQILASSGSKARIDLTRHQCLPFVMPSSGRCAPWLFRVDGRDIDWTPPGRIRVFDDVLGVVSLAESGLGICQSYDFIMRDRIEQGALSMCWSMRGAVPGLPR